MNSSGGKAPSRPTEAKSAPRRRDPLKKTAPDRAPFYVKILGGGNGRYLLERNADRFQPLGTGHHFHVDALTLCKFVDTFPNEHGTMDEDILAPLDRYETESLLGIVPLDLAVDLLGRTGCAFERAIAWRPSRWPGTTAWAGASARRLRGTCIDSGYLGDLRTLSSPDRPEPSTWCQAPANCARLPRQR